MKDLLIKEKLCKLGFTSGELKFITHWSEKERLPLMDIISQLRGRFIGGVFLRLLIVIFCGIGLTNESSGALLASVFTLVLGFLIMEIFAPFKVGAKIFMKYKRIKNYLD